MYHSFHVYGLLIILLCTYNIKNQIVGGNIMEIKSPAFNDGAFIPGKYTCDGIDISPPLQWTEVPEGTKTHALSGVHTGIFLKSMPWMRNLILVPVYQKKNYLRPWRDIYWRRGNWSGNTKGENANNDQKNKLTFPE